MRPQQWLGVVAMGAACAVACETTVVIQGSGGSGGSGGEGGDLVQPDPSPIGAGPSFDCGNGIVDPREDCDEWAPDESKKNTATCDVDCSFPSCDDAIQNNASGECCADSGEFPCTDRCLLERKETGDPNWCLCQSGSGDDCDPGWGGYGAGGCDGGPAAGSNLAGVVVNNDDPGSATPGNDGGVVGISSVWSYSGFLGVAAGTEMCAAIGGDHVCEWNEIVAAEAAGELGSILDDGQAFWVHRVVSSVVIPDLGTTSAPGSGARCNDWIDSGNTFYDSEVAVYNPGTSMPAGWSQIGTSLLHAKFDQDTTMPGTGTYDGLECAGQGAPANSTGSMAILCCYMICGD